MAENEEKKNDTNSLLKRLFRPSKLAFQRQIDQQAGPSQQAGFNQQCKTSMYLNQYADSTFGQTPYIYSNLACFFLRT